MICDRIIMPFESWLLAAHLQNESKCKTSMFIFIKFDLSFSYEMFCAWASFNTEAKGNLKMTLLPLAANETTQGRNNIFVLTGFQPTVFNTSLLVLCSLLKELQSQTVGRKYKLSCNYFSASTGMKFESNPLLFCHTFTSPVEFQTDFSERKVTRALQFHVKIRQVNRKMVNV